MTVILLKRIMTKLRGIIQVKAKNRDGDMYVDNRQGIKYFTVFPEHLLKRVAALVWEDRFLKNYETAYFLRINDFQTFSVVYGIENRRVCGLCYTRLMQVVL